ncbi:carboxymuconolactone decarboxylase family protein [Yoonia sp. R2-816]|uniref:carboxymuconolactone decarboxylase family protein n=1 Tax=Yoonia sp. R2-816 TaxID=3342638 RepID=UPI003728E8C4
MTVFANLGADSSIGDILFSDPDRYAPILAFAQDAMRSDGVLPHKTRELLAAYVSSLNECAFCHGLHADVAKRFGIDPSILANLLFSDDLASIEDELKPIFTLARKLTVSPSKVVEADRQAVLAAGHSEDVLKDVIAIVCLFSFFNRLVDGHGIKGNAEIFSRDSEMLAAFGYVPPAQ